MFRSTAALLAMFALAACSSSSPSDGDADKDVSPTTPSGAKSGTRTSRQASLITKGCKTTRCEQKKEQDSKDCGRCMDACIDAGYSCDISTDCDLNCAVTKCSESEEKTCVEEGFIVTLPEKDDDVAKACTQFSDWAVSCGGKATNCDTAARAFGPNAAQFYVCIADLPCKFDDDAFEACTIPPSTFGDGFCAKMNARCNGFCDDSTRKDLNIQGALMSERLLDALETTCAGQESCADARACYEAWAAAKQL